LKIYLLPLIFLLITACSGFSSPDEIDTYEIEQMIEDIRISFNLADIDQIMFHYHSEFFHNGDLHADEEIRWESRLTSYTEMKFSQLDIDVNDEFAVVYFDLEFISEDTSLSWEEPSSENGDISYLYFFEGRWRIYGNQLDADQLP